MKTYTSFDDLLQKKIGWIREDEKHYYVRLEMDPGINYDDSIWVVNKSDNKVTYMSYVDFAFGRDDGEEGLEEKTTVVDLSTIRRAS